MLLFTWKGWCEWVAHPILLYFVLTNGAAEASVMKWGWATRKQKASQRWQSAEGSRCADPCAKHLSVCYLAMWGEHHLTRGNWGLVQQVSGSIRSLEWVCQTPKLCSRPLCPTSAQSSPAVWFCHISSHVTLQAPTLLVPVVLIKYSQSDLYLPLLFLFLAIRKGPT